MTARRPGTFPLQRRPCAECPWRTDQPTGRFPPDRFRRLAVTAYDRSLRLFACHKTPEGAEATCAGFLLRGAEHNLSVRFALSDGRYRPELVEDSGLELHVDYRAMAVANGVSPTDPILKPCRGADD